MAVDALGLTITDKMQDAEELPKATEADQVNAEEGFLVVVEFDLMEYRKKHNNRAVKKTLSIPEWLNEEALARNINFSRVLQDASLKVRDR